MANKILSYELAPSPATIFGCLLPAPWIGAVAGLLLAFGPAEGVPNRFAPLVLAVTHVLALGMLAPIMIGALFQLFPVVAGQAVPGAKKISPFVALASFSVSLALSFGFLYGNRIAFILAMLMASLIYGAVVCALALAAWRMVLPTHHDASLLTLRWIALPLLMVLGLGVALAGGFAGAWEINLTAVLTRHVAWAGLGWVAALVSGIASTVVPMFWQSPKPSARWHQSVPVVLWLLLMLMTLFDSQDGIPYWTILLALVVMCLAAFAFKNVMKAKRRFDPAWTLWVACVLSWFSSALLYLMSAVLHGYLPVFFIDASPWWIGVLGLVGGAVFPVNAMLGKIIPFLVFLHLRRQIPTPQRIPTMQEVILPQHLRLQARLVVVAFLGLLMVPVAPSIILPLAGCIFAASQMLIGALILRALFRYRHELKRVIFAKN